MTNTKMNMIPIQKIASESNVQLSGPIAYATLVKENEDKTISRIHTNEELTEAWLDRSDLPQYHERLWL